MRTTIEVLALDVDGTLCDANEVFPTGLKATLGEWQLSGARVVLVSARAPRRLCYVAEKLALAGPIICAAGALTLGSKRQVLSCMPIASEDIHTIAAWVNGAPGLSLGAELGDAFAATESFRSPAKRLAPSGWSVLPEPLMPADLVGSHHIVISHKSCRPSDLALAASDALGPGVRVTEQPDMIDVCHRNVSKLAALAALCERWNVAPSAVLAAGDGASDAAMLSWAGQSIAPLEAHFDAHRAARLIARTPGPDGIAELLHEFLTESRTLGHSKDRMHSDN